MTAVKTFQNTITAPQTEYLIADFESQGRVETEEPESNLEWYRRWCRECNENRRKAGLPYEDPMTMEEIVAVVKEVRAERYARKQEQKNSTCR